MPRDNLPNGPALVQGEIQRDPAVSQQETILSGQGSQVSFGSLTAIPIDGGLVYVRPFYVTSNQTEVPGLEKVIVYFEGTVVIQAFVDREGHVARSFARISMPAFDDEALASTRSYRFRPARKRGEPIAVWVMLPVKFVLR